MSYFQGPSETPLLGITIGQGLEQRVDLNPDKEAVIFSTGNVRKTFGQLLEEVYILNEQYILITMRFLLMEMMDSVHFNYYMYNETF